MSSNQGEGMRWNQVESNITPNDNHNWDDHEYMGITKKKNLMYFPSQDEGKYHVNIVQLPEDLLYKEVPLTLYVSNEQVVKRNECL